jgi:Spy/CpxP family protein refolding chaperone
MSWIRMAIAGVAFLGVASVASAQAPHGGPGGHRMGRGEMSKMLFAGIELTDAQKDQIQKINEKYRAEREALRPTERQTPGSTDDATRAKMSELRTRSNAEYRAVLTADQQVIFDKNLADLKARKEQHPKQHEPQA